MDLFFLIHLLEFANVASPSFLGYGQMYFGIFTDSPRPFFFLQIPFGRGSRLLRAKAIASNFGPHYSTRKAPIGAPIPNSGSILRSCPDSMQLPWHRGCWTIQANIARGPVHGAKLTKPHKPFVRSESQYRHLFLPQPPNSLLAGLRLTPKMPAALPAPAVPHTASPHPRLHPRSGPSPQSCLSPGR